MFLFLSISAEWTILEGMTVFQCQMSYDLVSDILQASSVQLLEVIGVRVDTYLPLHSSVCVMHTCCESGRVLAVCFLSSWSTTWKRNKVKLCRSLFEGTGVFAVLVSLAPWFFQVAQRQTCHMQPTEPNFEKFKGSAPKATHAYWRWKLKTGHGEAVFLLEELCWLISAGHFIRHFFSRGLLNQLVDTFSFT